jgi:hypothetical protein
MFHVDPFAISSGKKRPVDHNVPDVSSRQLKLPGEE